MENNNKKLAVILPGIGYHKDKPLLYYAAKIVQERGYHVLFVEYRDMPQKIKGNSLMMHKAASIAYEQTNEQLKDIMFTEYRDILFIGKSIGTVALAKYVADHGVSARQIWYTPLEATFSFGKADAVAFIGDEDPWSDVSSIKLRADECGIKLYSYPGCNHSLECEDVDKNIGILRDVMKVTVDFIGQALTFD